MIPTAGPTVDVEHLHPQMKCRLGHFFADPRIDGNVVVISGARTRAHQARLFRRYQTGLGALAADPDRRLPGGWRGSFHQVQLDGFAHAVDLRIVDRVVDQATVGAIAGEYGLLQTVPGEWWHFQWRNADEVFPADAVPAAQDCCGAVP